MPVVARVNHDSSTVTASAGMTYGDLSTLLHSEGLALHNMASLPHISIAGAIATGTHGSGNRNGALHTAVRSMDVVMPDGSLERIKAADGDRFNGSLVGLGLGGIVTEVELAVEPTYEVAQVVYPEFPRSLLRQKFER